LRIKNYVYLIVITAIAKRFSKLALKST